MRRFPWLAERLKCAWAEVKEAEDKLQRLNSPKPTSKRASTSASILKQRAKDEKVTLQTTDDDTKPKTKVVFSRNVPLFVYNTNAQKAIRVGGDLSADAMTEEVYKAIEYNPELKKVTLDIQNLCNPNSDKSIHLAVSYLSATTNYNPLVISEHMARFSGKKETMIKNVVCEIEKRLLAQQAVRTRRDELWKQQLQDIVRARVEAAEKENDILVAKRQLEESRRQNLDVMTMVERQQERRRRIQLRSRVIPTADRLKPVQARTRRALSASAPSS